MKDIFHRLPTKKEIAYAAAGAVIGFLGCELGNTLNKPAFERIVYFDEQGNYRVDRIGLNEFEIFDTRPTINNQLHPDRGSHLVEAARNLQTEYRCEIADSREKTRSHTLIVDINNPQCIFDARDNALE